MSRRSFSYADLLERNARLFGELPALWCRGECVTHRELYARALALAGGLAARGVQPGDRLVVLSENRREVMELLGAAACLGASLVPLNSRLAHDEVWHALEDAAPRMVFASQQCAHSLDQLPIDIHLVLLDEQREGGGQYGELLQPISEPRAIGDGAPLLVMYTAATQGRSRGAVLTHRGLLSTAAQMHGMWRLDPKDRTIGVLPLFHVAGLGLALAVQFGGGATFLEAQFDPDRVVALAEDHGGSVLSCFPPMLDRILDRCEFRGTCLRHLRVVSGLESADTIRRLRERAPHVMFWSAYGQSETSGPISLSPFDERPGSAGRPLPFCAVRIVNSAGQTVGPGVLGDILVRGPAVFSGYWPLREGWPETVEGGWHGTGDLGWLDAQGYLWFGGRSEMKDLVKTGGENVYPSEVEGVLKQHPALADVAVLGIPDTTWGEVVKALCVLRPGATATADEIKEFVAFRLARFKCPKIVQFVDEIPRTESGRLDKSALE